MKKIVSIVAASLLALGLLSSCTTEADTVNHNIDKEAESFKVARNISFVNGITDKEMLRVTGFCSLEYSTKKIDVTCKVNNKFLRHTLARSDNVFAVSEQIEPQKVNNVRYKFIVRPGALIPDVDIQ